MKNYDHKMREGEHLGRSPNHPILSIVGDGKQSYIWVGNNAGDDMACFATIAGEANLRRIANDIIKQLGAKP